MQNYPNIMAPDSASTDKKVDDLRNFCNFVNRQRPQDVTQFNNLSQTFVMGRKVGKIPTSSTDVVAADRVGDLNFDASYGYICVNDSGSAVWRRWSLATW